MASCVVATWHRRGVSDGSVFGWSLVVALVVLVALAVGVSRWAGLSVERPVVIAATRAIVQLAAVSLIIAAVFDQAWSSALFAAAMFAVAVATAAGRIDA